MQATYMYGRSIWSAAAISSFDLPAGFICYILTCLTCLWATAELQSGQPASWPVVSNGEFPISARYF